MQQMKRRCKFLLETSHFSCAYYELSSGDAAHGVVLCCSCIIATSYICSRRLFYVYFLYFVPKTRSTGTAIPLPSFSRIPSEPQLLHRFIISCRLFNHLKPPPLARPGPGGHRRWSRRVRGSHQSRSAGPEGHMRRGQGVSRGHMPQRWLYPFQGEAAVATPAATQHELHMHVLPHRKPGAPCLKP